MQRDDGHGGCGVLALHPALWSLFNTFHTKKLNGFVEFSNISLWKDINRRSLRLPALWLFLQFFMPVKESHKLQSHSLLLH